MEPGSLRRYRSWMHLKRGGLGCAKSQSSIGIEGFSPFMRCCLLLGRDHGIFMRSDAMGGKGCRMG